jgi:peptidoglycan biosynthesis protein MviN/MurJ (putative lipid II flippase)
MSTDKSPRGATVPGEGLDSLKAIVKTTSLLSMGTLMSRILGFVRDIILARLLGTGVRADAFFVALRIPNLFRDLVGEGAVNAAVVPVLSEYLQHKKRESFWKFANVILVLALILLSGITLLGIIFAPLVVRVRIPVQADREKKSLIAQKFYLLPAEGDPAGANGKV